jgi:polyphosphate kinase 2 (PPK2 family)
MNRGGEDGRSSDAQMRNIEKRECRQELRCLQEALVDLLPWMVKRGLEVCPVSEGWDGGASTCGTIETITKHVISRVFRVVVDPPARVRVRRQRGGA